MTRRTRRSLMPVCATLSMLVLAGLARADDIYMSATSKRGAYTGDSAKMTGKIDVTKFSYEVVSPRDPASGQATGKRQHRPVRIVKPVNASSPQFFRAITTNELLNSVVIDFVGTGPKGPQLNYSVRLTNAFVTDFEQTTETDAAGVAHVVEAVEFTFQAIEVFHGPSQTVVQDTWTTPTS